MVMGADDGQRRGWARKVANSRGAVQRIHRRRADGHPLGTGNGSIPESARRG